MHRAQRRHDRADRVVQVGRRGRFDELDDIRTWIRVVGKPTFDVKSLNADGGEGEATVGKLGSLHDVGHRSDTEADVAAADLAAALDEHDAELLVALEDVAHHRPIPRFEDVQRQDRVRKQHGSEREHRHGSLAHGPVSAPR